MKPTTLRPVPLRALLFSVGTLAIPVAGAFIPDWQDQQGMLLWLTALVPAFLLAYYRGLKGVAVALAVGMLALVATHIILVLVGGALPPWPLLLTVVAIYVGVCIGIAIVAELLLRERQVAEEEALVDTLTGLPNRRHAEVMLQTQFAAAVRGRPMAVVMFDLDHFKLVNDKYGHLAGDEALRTFASILRGNTRRADLAARFGGEEFLAILTNNEPVDCQTYADRVRQELKHHQFWWGHATVSAGAAGFETGAETWKSLLESADRALYDAKQGGRDRVVVADLPAAASRESPVPSGRDTGDDSTRHVVVVDDDRDVLRTTVAMLERAGFDVEGTDDPHGLLRRWRQGSVRIDLLITDIMMPRMNGLILVDRLNMIRPGSRVIYVSGYMETQVNWAGLPGNVVGMLGKPFERDDLLVAVREGLEDGQPAADA